MYEITQYIGIGILGTFIWLAFEMWRAPLLEEQKDGSWKTLKPEKKLSDLFKKKKEIKNESGSYSDLEKLGRGRSKF